jgi:glycosyltransferase involved in cell wall biosynthesis
MTSGAQHKTGWKGEVGSFKPNVLLFFLSSKDSYRMPIFSRNEVFCSPDTEPLTLLGKITAIRTTPGSFDVREIVRALPETQKPELVIVKADASLRNCPRNLGKLKCPKVLIVGDTHHMGQPLQKLIRYAREEPFDAVIFDHTRHHARFFIEAGVRNVQWLPAVDYAYNPREIKEAPSHALTFVGQVGRYHPYRCAVIEHLRASGLPIETLRGTPKQAADIYADSQLTLNVSLNGDLNLRVFESLAAGGLLLTDGLAEPSGLPTLFEDRKHLVFWRSAEELVELIKYYLAHPAEALAIRRAGQTEIVKNHAPLVKIREFYDLVYDHKINPRYALDREKQAVGISRAGDNLTAHFRRTIEPYEAIQEIHRTSTRTRVYCPAPEALDNYANLPRLELLPFSALKIEATTATDSNILWWEGEVGDLETVLFKFAGTTVIAPRADESLRSVLGAMGFIAETLQSFVFRLRKPATALNRALAANQLEYIQAMYDHAVAAAQDTDEFLALASLAEKLGDQDAHRQNIQQAVLLDRNNQTALLGLAALSLDENQPIATLTLLEEIERAGVLPQEAVELKANLEKQVGGTPEMQTYYAMVGRAPVTPAAHPRRVLMVTNLFPPQELGGYGRKMWEFANGLVSRGHEVRVLTGNLTSLAKEPTPDEAVLERCVSRELRLCGTWTKGRAQPTNDAAEIKQRTEHNLGVLQAEIDKLKPDVVFAGNMDFLGAPLLDAALTANLPVLHALGNKTPGYAPTEQPLSPFYWIGSASSWTGAILQGGGYTPGRIDVIYPGARIDRFFRLFMPDVRKLRICYAGLVMPFKGVQTLVDALVHLHSQGIDFTAEIAGEATDPNFPKELRATAEKYGFSGKLRFTGFLDRQGLAALFARSNVLVFPSIVEEAFGISQVEALAAGLVVVSSGTGGAKEIIRDGVDGMLFPAANPGPLAERLAALARDQELFTRLQKAGQQRAMEFSVDRSVSKIEQLFEEMLS